MLNDDEGHMGELGDCRCKSNRWWLVVNSGTAMILHETRTVYSTILSYLYPQLKLDERLAMQRYSIPEHTSQFDVQEDTSLYTSTQNPVEVVVKLKEIS